MSGVPVAVVVFAAVVIVHIAVSHLIAVRAPERVLVAFMVLGLVLYLLTYLALIRSTATPWPIVDLAAGLAAMGFLTLGYVEFWSLIERSFSLRILIDTAGAQASFTADEIALSYGEGRGLQWMMQKRIEDLVGAGMLREGAGGEYALTARGRVVAWVFGTLQRVFLVA